MDWHALFVVTGKEEYVAEWLRFFFSESEMGILIPKRRLVERKDGKARNVVKKMFPGYVLVQADMSDELYYAIKRTPKLVRVLRTGDCYTCVAYEEITVIQRLLSEGDVAGLSKGYIVGSKLVIESGPLMGIEGIIKAVDRRKRRVRVVLDFMGGQREIDLGIEVVNT